MCSNSLNFIKSYEWCIDIENFSLSLSLSLSNPPCLEVVVTRNNSQFIVVKIEVNVQYTVTKYIGKGWRWRGANTNKPKRHRRKDEYNENQAKSDIIRILYGGR